jgi:hypothetical protein
VVSGWTDALVAFREAALDRLLRDWLEGSGFGVQRIPAPEVGQEFAGAAPRASFVVRDPQGGEACTITTQACILSGPRYIEFFLPLLVELRARERGEVRRLRARGGPANEVEPPAISILLRVEARETPQAEAETLVEQIARIVVDRLEAGKGPEDGRVSLMRLHGLVGMRRGQVDWDRYECEAGALLEKLLRERQGASSSP